MADLSVWLSVAMTLVLFSAFALYCRATILNESSFYISMWLLMAASSSLNGATYWAMTGDLVKSAIPVGGALATNVVLLIGWRGGKARPLTRLDWAVLGIGFAVIVVWMASGSASYANILLQLALLIAAIPVFVGVYRGRKEDIRPWLLWAIAQAISLVVIALRWEQNYDALVSPIMFLIMNLGVVVTVLLVKQRIRKNSRL